MKSIDISAPHPRGLTRYTAPRAYTQAIIAALLMVALGFALRGSTIDLPLARSFNGLHSGAIGAVTDTVYAFLKPPGAIVLTLLTAAAIWLLQHSPARALSFAATVALVWSPVMLIKPLVDRPRLATDDLPHPYLPTPSGLSFPSAHTIFALAFVLALIVAVGHTHARTAAIVAAPVLALAVLPRDVVYAL